MKGQNSYQYGNRTKKFIKIIRNFQIKNIKQYIVRNKNTFLILILILSLLLSITGFFIFGTSLILLNQEKFLKEGELSEIKLVKDQLKDITQNFEQLWIELLDKDFEIYKSIQRGEMNDFEALHILQPLVHRADLSFTKFLMTSKFHRISQFIKYDIFEYLTDLLVPAFHSEDSDQETSKLIVFDIIISKFDNVSEYLKNFTIYGEYDLTKFKEKYYLTEDNHSLYFMYDKTWEVFYNCTFYGIYNIYVNFHLFDAIIERFYVNDIKIVENKIVTFNIWLNFSNILIIILSLLIGLIKKKKKFIFERKGL